MYFACKLVKVCVCRYHGQGASSFRHLHTMLIILHKVPCVELSIFAFYGTCNVKPIEIFISPHISVSVKH